MDKSRGTNQRAVNIVLQVCDTFGAVRQSLSFPKPRDEGVLDSLYFVEYRSTTVAPFRSPPLLPSKAHTVHAEIFMGVVKPLKARTGQPPHTSQLCHGKCLVSINAVPFSQLDSDQWRISRLKMPFLPGENPLPRLLSFPEPCNPRRIA